MPECIERLFHYVWEGKDFPEVNFLALRSLLIHEPSAGVTVHFVGSLPEDHRVAGKLAMMGVETTVVKPAELFMRLPDELSAVGGVFSRIPTDAYSARSNLVRYALLYLHGGVYLDFDTFVMSPFGELMNGPDFVGREIVWRGDARRVAGERAVWTNPSTWHWAISWLLRRLDSAVASGRLGMSAILGTTDRSWQELQANNAVIGASLRSEFVAELLRRSAEASPTVRYATGPALVDKVIRGRSGLVNVVPPHVFYPVAPGESFRLFEDVTLLLPTTSVLVHWAASNHPRFRSASDARGPVARKGSAIDRIVEGLREHESQGEFEAVACDLH